MSKLKLIIDIEHYASEKLAEMIITHRYLGINEEACLLAMNELARRREILSDTFQYEQYITDHLAKLPPLNFNQAPGFNSLLNMFANGNKTK